MYESNDINANNLTFCSIYCIGLMRENLTFKNTMFPLATLIYHQLIILTVLTFAQHKTNLLSKKPFTFQVEVRIKIQYSFSSSVNCADLSYVFVRFNDLI